MGGVQARSDVRAFAPQALPPCQVVPLSWSFCKASSPAAPVQFQETLPSLCLQAWGGDNSQMPLAQALHHPLLASLNLPQLLEAVLLLPSFPLASLSVLSTSCPDSDETSSISSHPHHQKNHQVPLIVPCMQLPNPPSPVSPTCHLSTLIALDSTLVPPTHPPQVTTVHFLKYRSSKKHFNIKNILS